LPTSAPTRGSSADRAPGRRGLLNLVINVAHLGAAIEKICGDGANSAPRSATRVRASRSKSAVASPPRLDLLDREVTLVVSGDIYTG
jgi:hypothetical protein